MFLYPGPRNCMHSEAENDDVNTKWTHAEKEMKHIKLSARTRYSS